MGIDYNSFSSTQVFVLRLEQRMELNTIKKNTLDLRTSATPSLSHCNSQQLLLLRNSTACLQTIWYNPTYNSSWNCIATAKHKMTEQEEHHSIHQIHTSLPKTSTALHQQRLQISIETQLLKKQASHILWRITILHPILLKDPSPCPVTVADIHIRISSKGRCTICKIRELHMKKPIVPSNHHSPNRTLFEGLIWTIEEVAVSCPIDYNRQHGCHKWRTLDKDVL
jgi:hypothetical protein